MLDTSAKPYGGELPTAACVHVSHALYQLLHPNLEAKDYNSHNYDFYEKTKTPKQKYGGCVSKVQ